MKVDLYVYGDVALRKVAFSRQSETDRVYCAEVPEGSLGEAQDALVLNDGRTLSAYDVYVYAKVGTRGFRLLQPKDCEE